MFLCLWKSITKLSPRELKKKKRNEALPTLRGLLVCPLLQHLEGLYPGPCCGHHFLGVSMILLSVCVSLNSVVSLTCFKFKWSSTGCNLVFSSLIQCWIYKDDPGIWTSFAFFLTISLCDYTLIVLMPMTVLNIWVVKRTVLSWAVLFCALVCVFGGEHHVLECL